MKKKYLIANWKMNMSFGDIKQFEKEFKSSWDVFVDDLPELLKVVFCPSAPFLDNQINVRKTYIGAQNCSNKDNGALTGEFSAKMISDFCDYVILGHSERRKMFCETDALILEKIHLCIKYNLKVILCCGEDEEQRNNSNHFNIVKKQLLSTLCKIDYALWDKIIVAYEPVWAIGTGKSANIEEIEEMHSFIRNFILHHNKNSNIPILYGGSCNQDNIASIISCSNVDGSLVGSASLDSCEFFSMIKIVANYLSNDAF